MKIFFRVAMLSALFSITFVSYTSGWQVQNLSWLRALVYLEDSEDDPCEGQHEGYGRLYKHGCFVNPVSVVQSVSDVLNKVHQGTDISESEKTRLLDVVNFLRRWASERAVDGNERFMVAPYHFSWDRYGLEPGWVSGMAQGHIIEAMVAAYEVTGDKDYLLTAQKAANAFYVSIEEGGVTVWTDHGPWFEEYAQAGKDPSFALNGHVFAIEGLYRLSHYFPEYKQLVYQAVATTDAMIERFSTGWWSKYDLQGTMANQKYHHIHIRQLHWLGFEFGAEKLDKVGQDFLWAQIYPVSSVLRFIYSPTRFLGFLLILNFILFLVALCCFYLLYAKIRRYREER